MKVLLLYTKRRRSAADRFSDSLAYDVCDGRSDVRRLVYWMRPHSGLHPLPHKSAKSARRSHPVDDGLSDFVGRIFLNEMDPRHRLLG